VDEGRTKVGVISMSESGKRFAALACVLICSTASSATTVDDLCAPQDDPCVVTGTVLVDDGSTIDARQRELEVRGRLDVGSGTMTLLARSLVVDGRLDAAGGSAPGGTIVVLAGAVRVSGSIDAEGAPGGSVVLGSFGDLEFGGSANLDHLGEDEGGGDLTLTGTNVTFAGSVLSRGGANASGGDVTVTARGDLLFDGSIDLGGGDGGSVDFTAGDDGGGDLTIGAGANIQSNATGKGCDGGDVDLTADGAVSIAGRINANGRGGDDDTGGGSGGTLSVDATGDVIVPSSGARMSFTGATPDGSGGDVEMFSGASVSLRGVIDVHAGGGDSDGGSLSIDAEGAVNLQGNVLASGDGGGDVDVSSGEGELRVARGIEIAANATGGGGGGGVTMTSDAALVVEGTIRSDGSNGFGSATIELTACSLRIEQSGVLSSTRNGGRNTLVGRNETIVAGRLVADASTGANELRFADAQHRPLVLASAVINPPADEIADAAVQPCGQATPTATGTATPTPTPTPTRRPPVACVGDCNGDGQVDLAEVVRATNVALGLLPLSACEGIDADGDDRVTIVELVSAVDASMAGCI
jgi:hypothetical protein